MAGANLSKMTVKDPQYTNAPDQKFSPVIRYQLGVYKELYAGNNIIIAPGLLFIKKGYKSRLQDELSDGSRDWRVEFSPSYIQLPVDIAYRWRLSGGRSFDAGLNIYASYGIGGRGHTVIKLDGKTVKDEKFKLEFKNEADFSSENNVATYSPGYSRPLDVGGGIVVKYGFGNKMGVKLNADHSFFNLQSKIYGKKPAASAYNQQLRISVCYDL
ncbi:outer membrane beta-barrel protein [Niabella sp.]|uniref:outer membrane beta-barrel protein n=1 Tax=Niabella sp. TaxID=1962976 RepID=UPI002639F54F|nr:outer membrane beta-barrel protein [Niabella sp.]